MISSASDLAILPVTAERTGQLTALFRTGEPGGCWDMKPRLTPAEDRACRRRWHAEGTARKDWAIGWSGSCTLPGPPGRLPGAGRLAGRRTGSLSTGRGCRGVQPPSA
jgi:hypothetical protein